MKVAQRAFVFRRSAEFTPVKREHIYGCEHIFPQLQPIFDTLKNYRTYHREKIPVDGGAVLCGSPGMGKTLFARHIATESDARFVDVRRFPVEIKNGMEVWQPKDVAHLFALATEWSKKNNRPIVLFIDQADNFFQSAAASVKTQFELELDGFLERGAGIFLLFTSQNMPQVVFHVSEDDDEGVSDFGGALFRRGRIGIHIPFVKGDFTQSEKLLRGFLEDHPHEDNIACRDLVHLMTSPSAADIKYTVAEARQLARREAVVKDPDIKSGALAKVPIAERHLVEVFLSKTLDKASGHTMTEQEKENARVHEVGHYIVARAHGIAAHFVSVRPGLTSLGVTFASDDAKNKSHTEIRYDIAFCAGGWEAERLCGIPQNTGKRGDIEMVNDFTEYLIFLGDRKKLGRYGKMDLGRWTDDGNGMVASQGLLAALEDDTADIIVAGEKRARMTLRFFGKQIVRKLARALAESPHDVMLRQKLDAMLQPKLAEFHRRYHIVDHIRNGS